MLEARVVSYERRVYSYTPDQEPQEYIVAITLGVVLKDRVKNKDLWSNEALRATATYSAIEGGGFRSLREEQRVEFAVEQGNKGLQAVQVRAV